MFEDKKWSQALKKEVADFLFEGDFTKEDEVKLTKLIDTAIEEGRQEVLDDPRSFDLVSKEEAHEREPQRDESRD
jgi:hypothetical protein